MRVSVRVSVRVRVMARARVRGKVRITVRVRVSEGRLVGDDEARVAHHRLEDDAGHLKGG